MITHDELLKVIYFDPETGVFRWLARQGSDHLTKSWNTQNAGVIAGVKASGGYVQIGIHGKRYSAHRLAWLYVHGKWPAAEIDHKNGNRADNRISNLREATRGQNSANRGRMSSNKTGFKGVFRSRLPNRWSAEIKTNGRRHYLGHFDCPLKAAAAYAAAAAKFHGEFARSQ